MAEKKKGPVVGRRKSAVARAMVRPGSGKVYINGRSLDSYEPELARMRIREPLDILEDMVKKLDIYVNVAGGGFMGQADASRTAIARALIEYSGDEQLHDKLKALEWTLVKSDVRRKEAGKPGGPGARAKYQKSYR